VINKVKVILFILLAIYFKSEAQVFYVSAVRSGIHKVTVTPSGLQSVKVAECTTGDQYFSIAMNKDKMYWLNLSNIHAANVKDILMEGCTKLFPNMGNSNALTLGADNKLYYAAGYLLTTDINTGKSEALGALNYAPSGDMCFYNKDLYMASVNGIVKVNLKNPSQSTLHIPMSQQLFGIVSVATGLRKNTVYGLVYKNDLQTNVIELDMENQKIIRDVGILPYSVLDAASPVEDGSTLGIELDKVDITQDCSSDKLAIVDIITRSHFETYTFTLNGISNTTGKFAGLKAGNYPFTITSESDAYSGTLEVPEYDLIKPDYTWKARDESCGNPGAVTFSTPEASSTYQVRYLNKLYPINSTLSGLTAGSIYHFEIVNKNGCLVETVDIPIQKDKCRIILEKVTIERQCDAFNKGVVTVLTQAHTASYKYFLNGIETNNSGIFKNLLPGSYNIKIVSDEDEIETTAVVPDYKSLQPVFNIISANPACAVKGRIKFNPVTNGESYRILYKGVTFPFEHEFNNLDAGSYSFTVVNQQGCLIEEKVAELVYEPCAMVIDEIQIQQECNILGKGVAKIISPTIPEVYTFTLNNSISNHTGVFEMLAPGSYEIEVKASGGAQPQYSTFTVPDYNLTKPLVRINAKNPVCDLSGQISFSIGEHNTDFMIRYNGIVYQANHNFIGLYAGNYHFDILKANGCIADEVDVTLEEEACNDISFPNAFSPNSDNVNDFFKAKEGSRATNFKLQIFDRRGALMFSSNRLYDSWNGDYKGAAAPVGSYFWVASFTTQENKVILKKGSVTLIR